MTNLSQRAGESSEERLELHVPETAIIPEGATFYEGEDDGRCRLIKATGDRCRASRIRAVGLCPGHAGRGGVAEDPYGTSRLAAVRRTERKQTRMMLGISARRASQPTELARYRAQERAEGLATALVDAPLDDPEVGTIARQQAVIRALELLYPQVTAQVQVDVPEDADQLAGMGWEQVQQLAQAYLGEGHQGDTT